MSEIGGKGVSANTGQAQHDKRHQATVYARRHPGGVVNDLPIGQRHIVVQHPERILPRHRHSDPSHR
jgi:hypothetical protein